MSEPLDSSKHEAQKEGLCSHGNFPNSCEVCKEMKSQKKPEKNSWLTGLKKKIRDALRSPSEVEIAEKLPKISLEEIAVNPKEYENRDLIKTEGYPQPTGEKTLRIPVFVPQTMGNITTLRADWITKKQNFYKLFSSPDQKGHSIDMISEVEVTYFPNAPLTPGDAINTPSAHRHEIVGQITKVEDQEGRANYMLRIKFSKDLEVAQA